MTSEAARQPEADTPRAAKSRSAKRFQIGVGGLIVAVACCGVVAWSARSLWESQHPVIDAARGLQSSDAAERVAAARQLLPPGLLDPGRAIPALVAALGDPEVQVRVAAAVTLGALGGEVVGTTSAGDAVRDAVKGLIGALKDREPSVRMEVVRALALIVQAKGAPGVIDLQAVIDALAGMLGDRDDGVRRAVFYGLRQCGPLAPSGPPAALVAVLEDRSARNRAGAIEALAAFPISLDPWLTSILGSAEHDPETRSICQMAIGRAGAPAFSADAIPALVVALGSPSRIVRSFAAKALEPHASAPRCAVAVPVLLNVLREPFDPELEPSRTKGWNGWDPAAQAASLLGQIAPGTRSAGEVIAALTEVVRSGHPLRRASAANALGQFGPAAERAVPALIGILSDVLAGNGQDPYDWGYAGAKALGAIAPGTKSADDALAVLIKDLDSGSEGYIGSQHAAIEALPAFGKGAARALPRLRDLQKDKSPAIRAAADKAVTAIEAAISRG
jgi:HEAT repeat protein